MTVFITGGSGSGKSAFAESIAQKLGGSLVYVATMPVANDEDKAKVERHHALRAGKGFVTLERPGKLADLPDGGETMLIECLSTHVANLMFSPGNTAAAQDTTLLSSGFPSATAVVAWTESIKKELAPLISKNGNTIFVSAEIASDGATYSPETKAYRSVLTAINRHLADSCDTAVEVVCGIPVRIKGELPC
ncbi:MAG: bifunctional adenosylcobinamide kinase/adenosylcobinamide-phosphate guanylyltransferase [Spirochaetia bacterium]|nr:bifunctional adenosylcobinamide kinase/adenosylcobinamide-phosphate guanylyltransferase [Spirochaetia bacterium]